MKAPKRFGILLYPGFEALDAFGPMEVVNDLSREHDITLSVIAASRDPVSTLWKGVHKVGQSVMPTHTFADDPELDVLLIPGGVSNFQCHFSPSLGCLMSKHCPKWFCKRADLDKLLKREASNSFIYPNRR